MSKIDYVKIDIMIGDLNKANKDFQTTFIQSFVEPKWTLIPDLSLFLAQSIEVFSVITMEERVARKTKKKKKKGALN
jgi:hypothetical protein